LEDSCSVSANPEWLGKQVIKQPRTLETHIMVLIQEGFAIEEVREWIASQEQIEELKGFKGVRRGKPHYLLVGARRTGSTGGSLG